MTISSIRVNQGGGIEFRDFTVSSSTYNGCNCAASGQSGYVVREITYRRIKMKQFFIRGADKISYIDGEVGPNGSEDGMNWISEPYQSSKPGDRHPLRRHEDPRLHEAQRGRARRLHRDRQRRRHHDPEHAHLDAAPTSRSSSGTI